METLSIFGSCMSRDAFRLHPVEGIELKSYIARQSIHSAVAKPMEIPVPMETIQNVSPFNQRMVYQDLNKTTFDVLGKDGSKWAMLDLIDERFALVYWGGTLVTESSEFVKSGSFSGAQRVPRKFDGTDWFVEDRCVREDIRLFCRRMLDIYDSSHIILHKAYATKRYRSKTGDICSYSDKALLSGQRLNDLISYMYEALEECLPGATVIDCCDGYLGDEGHLWGLSTVHYEDAYYAAVMGKLRATVLGK